MDRKTTIVLFTCLIASIAGGSEPGKPAALKSFVIDSACAFTKGLDKPISAKCATACAKAGSPLVVLADDGTIYWPISSGTPSKGQTGKLLSYAGQRVSLTGLVFERGGSKASRLKQSVLSWLKNKDTAA